MLISIRIDNFALVEHLELDIGNGLNVMTGETGAGKSIILDAIDVVLGGKANQRMLRSGEKKAIVEASFQINQDLETWLENQEIESLQDGTLICSRVLTVGKDNNFRSRCRVNGVLVNKPIITMLREKLLEITAQGETGQLLSGNIQRELLDTYGGDKLISQRELVANSFTQTQKAEQILESRRQSEQQRLQRLDLIKHQIQELNTVHLQDADELPKLEIESDRLTHVVDLQQLSYQVYQLLYQNEEDNTAAADIIGQSEGLLTDMVSYDKELAPILDMIKDSLNQIVEAGQQIYSYGSGLEADPDRLEEIEERIRLLKRICRKYGDNLADVIKYHHDLQEELVELTDEGQSIDELEKRFLTYHNKLLVLCDKLTQQRQKAAEKLQSQLTEQLKPLGMAKVQFQCRVIPVKPHLVGADRVEYYFSSNPGEDLQPLAMTASGGEMSRFLLALKSCFSPLQDNCKTLIFDEIDAGVSGKVAQAIADKLHQLSKNYQVLCVTHQPLVAAMADNHFRVEKRLVKSTDGQNLRTIVDVRSLENIDRRRDELAELTGGHSADDAIAFADSLLETAEARKKMISK